ncbi:MAG: type II toxin-antitoxin system RelE/ParE family toxin [Candidatus Diapherotrites archaeon]|nr:type II toxin-antitoxin system RelE/ParE family toxin [Candidatus Diapherotrites archaeon]
MTYEIIFDKEAIKFLEKLLKNVRERIFNKIMGAKERPGLFFEKLSRRDDYKMRIGSYRAIADIDHTLKRISVTKIGHRRNVYKRI